MRKIKNILAIVGMMLPTIASAEVNAGQFHISEMVVNKGDSLLTLNMKVNPADYRIKANQIVTLTPRLEGAGDTICMPSIRIAGGKAWLSEVREGNDKEGIFTRAHKGAPVDYSFTMPYGDSFRVSNLYIQADTTDICNCRPASAHRGSTEIIKLNFAKAEPPYSFRYAEANDTIEKIFDLRGRANVIFKVNSTEIDWTYAGNHAELDTILATIAAVRDNPDATVKGIRLTGYASPEGSYSNNVRLAEGRTEAVKDYVMKNSTFPASIYHTSSVPEDWEGLREWIAGSSIENRDAMLAFIDDKSVSEEKRNDLFRRRFPEQYPFLLANVYPTLRHTDYVITYNIRRYYDVEEIAGVIKTNPRNLSLNEMTLLANSYGKGTPEYDEVYLTAARVYPDSDIANFNAANSSVNRGELTSALHYLERVTPSPEVDYLTGIIFSRQKRYPEAIAKFRSAAAAGITEASEAITLTEEAANPVTVVKIL